MADIYECPVEGCDHAPFENLTGLKSHIRSAHPEYKAGGGDKEVPDVVNDFELLLKDYGVKRATIIATNISATGGPDVFNSPEEMAKKLANWPREITPVYRRTILEHWFKSRGIPIPKGFIEEVGLEEDEKKVATKKKTAEKKLAEGAVWTVDVDESGMPKIRMIKDETEPGVTLAEAKTAAKEIGKEQEEPIVVYNEETRRHMPNFKSTFVKQNLSAAWATARQMDKAIVEGEPVDPMDIWLEQQAKVAQLKDLMGISPESKEKSSMLELITALKSLQEMVNVAQPGDSEVIKAVKDELAEVRKTLDDMKDQKFRDEIAGQQQLITTLTQKVTELTELVKDPSRLPGVKTEMDILYQIATEGTNLLKTELPNFRKDVREALGSLHLPPGKSSGERESRKQRYRGAIQDDKELESIGKRLFFGES